MTILFLFVSLPNLKDDNGIFSSLIKEFRDRGHLVLVSTKGNNIEKTVLCMEDNIPVLRIKSHDFTGVHNSVKKALAYQEYALKQARVTYKYFKKERVDIIISHSLPPELPLIVGYLKSKFRSRFYLIQSDFTWQDAVALGYFSKHSPVAFYYRFWEQLMFKQADIIGCPTKGNFSFIKKLYPKIDNKKFRFLPFWQQYRAVEKDDTVKERLGLKGKFVVVYGGSVGAAQRVERLVELAEACAEYKDMSFVILGRGVYLSVIKQMVVDKHLTNVIFKEFMPQNEYLQFLSSCDVGTIILHEKLASPNFPSKALSYLNMKVPILAALDYTTDFGEYLEENSAGLWGYSDDIPMLKEKLMRYYHSPEYRKTVRENGYALFVNNMTPTHACTNIIKDLEIGE